jgi:hypothetical protein
MLATGERETERQLERQGRSRVAWLGQLGGRRRELREVRNHRLIDIIATT